MVLRAVLGNSYIRPRKLVIYFCRTGKNKIEIPVQSGRATHGTNLTAGGVSDFFG
jgi:hypothetical protein